MRVSVTIALVMFWTTAETKAQSCPALPVAERIRIGAASTILDRWGNEVWAGWTRAPRPVLLVRQDHEYLIRHPNPPKDFGEVERDAELGDIACRPRQYGPTLLATFPLGGLVPTVVIGTPDATGLNSTAWVVTLLHEQFHQLQYSQPGYYDAVGALDLADGDQTGMWMLNYPFPYDSAPVYHAFNRMAAAMAAFIAAGTDGRRVQDTWAALTAAVDDRDRRYLEFQLWQEGVARYTEIEVARRVSEEIPELARLRGLPDYVPFADVARSTQRAVLNELRDASLEEYERVAFYAFGAGIGLVLDRITPDWRTRYLVERFTLRPY